MSAEQTPDIEALCERAWDALDAAHDNARHVHAAECCWSFPGVLEALAPVLAAAVRDAEQRALREAADEAEALKTPSQGNNPQSHVFAIGYGTARRLIVRQLCDRADRVAEDEAAAIAEQADQSCRRPREASLTRDREDMAAACLATWSTPSELKSRHDGDNHDACPPTWCRFAALADRVAEPQHEAATSGKESEASDE